MKFRRFIPLLLTLILLAGCGETQEVSSAPTGTTYPADALAVDVGFYYGDFPGGIQPAVRVGNQNFYFAGTANALHGTGTPGAEVYVNGDEGTFLPEGYTEAGEISSVTDGPLTGELQFRAGCGASGTVYTSEDTPEVVYVNLTADWFDVEGPVLYRFVSETLKNQWVLYGGNRYLISIGTGECEALEALPPGCEKVGTLDFIGMDRVPGQDLETNCPSDTFGKALTGRDVFFDPAHPEYIYIYEPHYWAQGNYPAYLACPVMEGMS